MSSTPLGIIGTGPPPGTYAPAEEVSQYFRPDDAERPSAFQNFIMQQLVGRYAREDADLDRRRYQKGTRNAEYYAGNQNSLIGRYLNNYYAQSTEDQGDTQRVHNSFRYYSDAITSQWVNAEIELRVLPVMADDADDHSLGAAHAASRLLDYGTSETFSQEFRQDDCKIKQFFGGSFWYSAWDPTAGPVVQEQEFMQSQITLAGGGYQCLACGNMGESPIMGGCARCGAPIQQEPPVTMNAPMFAGSTQRPGGAVRTELVIPLEVKFDRIAGKFEKANWIRRRRRLRTEQVTALLPWYSAKQGSAGGDSVDDPGIQYQRFLQRSLGNMANPASYVTSGQWTGAESGSFFSTVDQWWFSPSVYSDPQIKWDQPIQLAGGAVIPPNTCLAEVFPTGLYILLVDNKFLDQREEAFLDHWVYTPFISIPTRADGDGIEDMCEPARQKNRFLALVEENSAYRSAPPTLIRAEYLKRAKYGNKPREVYPVHGLPDNVKLEDTVYQPQGTQLPPEVFQFIEFLDSSMQMYSKAWSTSTGAPDQKAMKSMGDTATAASLMSQNANSQRAPELALHAGGMIRWARNYLKLFQQNAVYSRWIPFKGKYGEQDGQFFQNSDIDGEFYVYCKPRSWLPKTEMDRQQRLQQVLQVFQQAPEFMSNPHFREHVAEIYDLPLEVFDDSDPDKKLARRRMDQLTKAQGQVGQMSQMLGVPPEQMLLGVIDPPIHPTENHQVAIQWYSDWLRQDEGINAGQMLRAAVTALMDQHMQIASMTQQAMGMQQLATQAPMIQAQQQLAGGPSGGPPEKKPDHMQGGVGAPAEPPPNPALTGGGNQPMGAM